MRVLDIGSGVGDVALLISDIVGPGGRVVGLDRDEKTLERACQRAKEQGCSAWVSFQITGLDDFFTTEQFDAVVGRYVLLYQPDAAATIRRLTSFLMAGSIVVFHECDFTSPNPSFPSCQLYDQVYGLRAEVFRRSGAPPDFGRRLGRTFPDAGPPFPTIVAETVIGGGRSSSLIPWIAETLVNLAPRMTDLQLTAPVVMDHTLAGKLEEAVVALGCLIMGSTQYGAWARKLS
jgi:SAM-dependent methyltransferase